MSVTVSVTVSVASVCTSLCGIGVYVTVRHRCVLPVGGASVCYIPVRASVCYIPVRASVCTTRPAQRCVLPVPLIGVDHCCPLIGVSLIVPLIGVSLIVPLIGVYWACSSVCTGPAPRCVTAVRRSSVCHCCSSLIGVSLTLGLYPGVSHLSDIPGFYQKVKKRRLFPGSGFRRFRPVYREFRVSGRLVSDILPYSRFLPNP